MATKNRKSRTGKVIPKEGIDVKYVPPSQEDPTPGLIDNYTAKSGQYTSAGYDVGPNGYYINTPNARISTREVGDNELAGNRLNALMDPNSIWGQRAQQEGKDFAASRGLMNSSIAGGNAYGAWIDRAQPLALDEAGAYRAAASENMSAENQAYLQNANLKAQANMTAEQLNAARDSEYRQHEFGASDDYRRAALNVENREDTQEYGTSEREGTQEYNTGEREATQDYNTSERLGTEEFNMKLAKMDEAIKMAGIAQADRQAYLQAWTLVETGKFNSIGQAGAAIYGNTKLKPAEQNAAVNNMMSFFSNIAPEIPVGFNPFAEGDQAPANQGPVNQAPANQGPVDQGPANQAPVDTAPPPTSGGGRPVDSNLRSQYGQTPSGIVITPASQGGPAYVPTFNFNFNKVGLMA